MLLVQRGNGRAMNCKGSSPRLISASIVGTGWGSWPAPVSIAGQAFTCWSDGEIAGTVRFWLQCGPSFPGLVLGLNTWLRFVVRRLVLRTHEVRSDQWLCGRTGRSSNCAFDPDTCVFVGAVTKCHMCTRHTWLPAREPRSQPAAIISYESSAVCRFCPFQPLFVNRILRY